MAGLFLKLLNMSIAASWLILAVALKKAPRWIVVLLWGIVALRLTVPFSLESTLSLVPSAETVGISHLPSGNARPLIETGFPALDSTVNDYIGDTYYEGVTVPVSSTEHILHMLCVLWLAGTAAMLLYALISYARVRRSVAEGIPYGRNIYLCNHVRSPFILGLLRPAVYLPSELDEPVIEAVVAHERAHLERGDHWWKPLGFLILAVHWFNPLCWLAYGLFCRDIELACDEKVIGQMDLEGKKQYSAALLACSTQRRVVTVSPLAFGEIGIKERVKNVLHYKKPALWAVILAAAVCAAMTAGFATDPVSDRSKNEEGPVSADGMDELAGDGLQPYIDGSRRYGFPFVLAQFTEDLDGDGTMDTVELLEDWYPIFNEQNEPSYDRWIWHRPAVRAAVGEETFFLRWDEASCESTLIRMEDRAGRAAFIARFDLGGGSWSLSPLTCSDKGLELLPLPVFRTSFGPALGFAAEAAYTDHWGVSVSVPETGSHGTFYVPELSETAGLYDEEGNCIDPGYTLEVGGLCGVFPAEYQGQNAIEIVQSIGEGSGANPLGYLSSIITWDDRGYVVLDQRAGAAGQS